MAVPRDNVSGSYSQDHLQSFMSKPSNTGGMMLGITFQDRIVQAARRSLRFVTLAAITTLTIGLSGCCFFGGGSGSSYGLIDKFMDKQVACMRDHVWAKRAFHLQYGRCERIHADHFRDGFIAGYCNICDGNNGECPAMAPERYWGFQYQSPEGIEMQNAWFAGFESGAGTANSDGSGNFRDIQISKQMEQILLLDQSIKQEHAGVRKSSVYGNPIVFENSTPMQNSYQVESTPQLMAPMSNSPMSLPQNSWQPASSKTIPQQPLPMQTAPIEVPIIVAPPQR